jgi:hypothetical protein
LQQNTFWTASACRIPLQLIARIGTDESGLYPIASYSLAS